MISIWVPCSDTCCDGACNADVTQHYRGRGEKWLAHTVQSILQKPTVVAVTIQTLFLILLVIFLIYIFSMQLHNKFHDFWFFLFAF